MVTQSPGDAEGTLPTAIRRIDPSTPIGVTPDMHANIFEKIVANATVVTGYHT